jgi:hypothetical protein
VVPILLIDDLIESGVFTGEKRRFIGFYVFQVLKGLRLCQPRPFVLLCFPTGIIW